MTQYTIDNTIGAEIGRTITWQYDNATHLVAYIMMLKQTFDETTKSFWEEFSGKLEIAGAVDKTSFKANPDAFGLSVWGKVLNCPRPNITVNNVTKPLEVADYRNILVARLRLLQSKGTLRDYLTYVSTAFGNKVTVADGNDMTLTFTAHQDLSNDLKALISQHPDVAFIWPSGVRDNTPNTSPVFCFDGQQNRIASDPTPGRLADSEADYAASFAWFDTEAETGIVFTVITGDSTRSISFTYIAETPARVIWGDGNEDTLAASPTASTVTHTWQSNGTFKVDIIGGVVKFAMQSGKTLVKTIIDLGNNLTDMTSAFSGCTSLTGTLPAWGKNVINATSAYEGCSSLVGPVPAWGASITNASNTFKGCTSLTGTIQKWGSAITNATSTYEGCTSLSGVWSGATETTLMPSGISTHTDCVKNASINVRNRFYREWGGLLYPGAMKVSVTNYGSIGFGVVVGSGGGAINWGDGNSTDLTAGSNTVSHTYTTNGTYEIDIGNATSFTGTYSRTQNTGHSSRLIDWGNTVTTPGGIISSVFNDVSGAIPAWGSAITDASGVYNGCTGLTGAVPAWRSGITSAANTFKGCTGLTGVIPEWGTAITNATSTYEGCTGLRGVWIGATVETLMPNGITSHTDCVKNASSVVRDRFALSWGGTYYPGSMKIEVVNYASLGFVVNAGQNGGIINWGDGNSTVLSAGANTVSHTYASNGTYEIAIGNATSFTGSYSKTQNTGHSSRLIDWGNTVTTPGGIISSVFDDVSGTIPAWGSAITNTTSVYEGCTGLNGTVPAWTSIITNATNTFKGCTGLIGAIPAWGSAITNTTSVYEGCTGLNGTVPAWTSIITSATSTYEGCTSLTGVIPAWGSAITSATSTYEGCTSLSGVWIGATETTLMPTGITSHTDCVKDASGSVRSFFNQGWGGSITDGSMIVEMQNYTSVGFGVEAGSNGGTINWGDGNSTVLSAGANTVSHNYTTNGTYRIEIVNAVSFSGQYRKSRSDGHSSRLIRWGNTVTTPDKIISSVFDDVSGTIPEWGSAITNANWVFNGCTGLIGAIPAWGANITSAYWTYYGCSGLNGNVPAWTNNITNAYRTYCGCSSLSGPVPAWGNYITNATETYKGCVGLNSTIPAWGTAITNATSTYENCSGLTGVWSGATDETVMPSRITAYSNCVTGTSANVRSYFDTTWGGTCVPGSMRIEVTNYKMIQIPVKSISGGGIIKWGDGAEDTITAEYANKKHTYGSAGTYMIEFVNVDSFGSNSSDYSKDWFSYEGLKSRLIRWGNTITDTGGVIGIEFSDIEGSVPAWGVSIINADKTYNNCSSLTGEIPDWSNSITSAYRAFRNCSGLIGRVPEWGSGIEHAGGTYAGCSGLTGRIPAWGRQIINAEGTYAGCSGLSGVIPIWGASITTANTTYYFCTGLTGVWARATDATLMPEDRITSHNNCVFGASNAVRSRFLTTWGGTRNT